MELTFGDRMLEKVEKSAAQLSRTYGTRQAAKIRQRLDSVRALQSADQLFPLPGNWHALRADRGGQLAVDLLQPTRLVFEATAPAPFRPDGGVDWFSVTALTAIEMINYY